MAKLKMLKSTLPILDTTRGLKMLKTLRKAKATGRDADPRRVLPLNGHAWQKLRKYILEQSPLCEHCEERGLTVEATDVDHIDGDPGNNSMSNLASLCHSCHSIKTAADKGNRIKTGHGVDGLPLSGEWAKP